MCKALDVVQSSSPKSDGRDGPIEDMFHARVSQMRFFGRFSGPRKKEVFGPTKIGRFSGPLKQFVGRLSGPLKTKSEDFKASFRQR